MRKKKKIPYFKVMKAVLHDDYVDCWGRLYERLGVFKWFEDRMTTTDVSNIYMTQRFRQYIDQILRDKYATGRGKGQIFWWSKTKSSWDSVCYSPVDVDYEYDCMILDITKETDKIKSKDWKDHMPKFKE